MSRYDCARCDWKPSEPASDYGAPRTQLAEHAQESGHSLCIVCQRRSLDVHTAQTCPECVGNVRAALAGIPTLHADLWLEITGYSSDTRPDKGHGSEAPLPGADPLILSAGGASGSVKGRRLTTSTPDGATVDYPEMVGRDRDGRPVVHPAWRREPQEVTGREHAADQWQSDPPSILAELAGWEDDLREHFGDGAAGPASVTSCVDYLMRRLDLAAQRHPAFDEFSATVRGLRTRLDDVLHLAGRPERAGADCFDCGEHLYREWTDTGYEDVYRCRGCKRVYTPAEYFLALRAALEAERTA